MAKKQKVRDVPKQHKLGENWSCFLLIGNTLQPKGKMCLEDMKADGTVKGTHTDPKATPKETPISGRAVGFGPLYQLTLKTDDGHNNRYEGMLVHESPSGSQLVVVGTKHYGRPGDKKAEFHGFLEPGIRALDQDDPAWVITKP